MGVVKLGSPYSYYHYWYYSIVIIDKECSWPTQPQWQSQLCSGKHN